ncbi:MAG: hypothetical protein FJX74_22345 [Armatimonadetes bacterium]|nr:hypothetical protein [Armatimonadota bacterium]
MPIEQRIPPDLEAGPWEGQYLDANGFRGTLRLDISRGGREFEGTFELDIRDEEGTQRMSGELRGTTENGIARIRWYRGKQGEPVETESRHVFAGSYARQALLGMGDPVPDTSFGGGVWIVWRFASKGER